MAHQSFFKADMRPAALERADRRKVRQSVDDTESQKCKVRSGGQCEIVIVVPHVWTTAMRIRCERRAFHVHHMLGGIGVRGIGESAKAIRKQNVCPDHHTAIGNHTLVRQGGVVPHWKDPYTAVR